MSINHRQHQDGQRTDSGDSSEVITQAMLTSYGELHRLYGEYQRVRRRLLQLLENGAPIEPGFLTLDVERWPRQWFTLAGVTRAIGEEACRHLQSQMPVVLCRHLVVRPHRMSIRRNSAFGEETHDVDRP